jgi:ABC-type bacteriocin/lantibiotic exporter with double-glycine peptidase domain
MRLVSNKIVEMNNKLVQYRGKMQGTAMSGLKVIETLKATGSESDFFSKWAGYYAKTVDEGQKIGVFTQVSTGIPSFLTSLTNTFILIMGGLSIMNGNMTVGSLVAFQSLAGSFLGPVNELVGMGNVLNEVQADMTRLDDIFNYPVDEEKVNSDTSDSNNEFHDKLEGYVETINLTFGYNILEPPLIEGFNLSLKPGSRVALVGGSGSGKSTIAKVIAGLYKPWSGEILFDGKNRYETPKAIINNSLSVVDQDICMFSGSIKENISLWDNTISELDMLRAAKDACIHDDIAAKAGGYNFLLNEGGTNFSGGQRQRLEIARALSNNPSIIILDEATSALDPMTEKIVDENIRRRGCTCIIVAHRLSTIRDCDEIIVLEKGKIVQRGTHDELKALDGHYAKLIKAI